MTIAKYYTTKMIDLTAAKSETAIATGDVATWFMDNLPANGMIYYGLRNENLDDVQKFSISSTTLTRTHTRTSPLNGQASILNMGTLQYILVMQHQSQGTALIFMQKANLVIATSTTINLPAILTGG